MTIPATEPKYVAETLAWCNARRAEQGRKPLKRLPKGEISNPRSCPCGKATSLSIAEESYYDYDSSDETERTLPRAVQRFVAAFDDGKLPQYEAKS